MFYTVIHWWTMAAILEIADSAGHRSPLTVNGLKIVADARGERNLIANDNSPAGSQL
jgi:hypothetical protein